MNRALLSGLSGTLANQTYIDVLGNNVANANTTGFKEGRVTFQDAFYQTLQGGRAGASPGMGGLDPVQVGSGTDIGQIQTLYTQGSMHYTGAPLDVALEGQGMLVLREDDKTLYTRDGSFILDNTCTLVSGGSGMKVMGWLANGAKVDTTGPLTELQFPIGQVKPGQATTAVTMAGNLDASLDAGATQNATIAVYDSLGIQHEVVMTFTKTAANAWTCTATVDAAAPGSGSTTMPAPITFDDADGSLASGGTLHLSAAVTSGATTPLVFDIDLAELSQLSQTGSNALALNQNGTPSATLSGISLLAGGDIQGEYSDGNVEVLGKLAVAAFPNYGGLMSVGNSLYQPGADSGSVDVGAAGSGGRGQVQSRCLEMSNVDLTRSFVEMMSAQRGFQASTRVIAAANRLLDDIMQLNVS
jgi:flagellar hook protein FlgE